MASLSSKNGQDQTKRENMAISGKLSDQKSRFILFKSGFKTQGNWQKKLAITLRIQESRNKVKLTDGMGDYLAQKM